MLPTKPGQWFRDDRPKVVTIYTDAGRLIWYMDLDERGKPITDDGHWIEECIHPSQRPRALDPSAVAGLVQDLTDQLDQAKERIATLEAQLAAVTPWEIVGRVPTEEESAVVEAIGGAWLVRVDGTLETSTPGSPSFGWLEEGPWKCDLWVAVTPDGRPMPKPAHIP